ncbi:MAG: hypothetical protein IT184_04210 [Acidobacteria bacterium]|nr:hypothetical protein [Acidobacteriota bacterium]
MTVTALIAALACDRAEGAPQAVTLANEFHAVVLDNNAVYFGRVEQFGGPYLVLRNVYYVQTTVKPETKEPNSVLIRRGREWHAPDRMIIDSRHVVFVEPVTAESRVARLIAEDRARQ